MDAKLSPICDRTSEDIAVGDQVQWECNGKLMFSQPRQVIGVSDDGKYAYVEGRPTPLPLAELTAVAPPYMMAMPVTTRVTMREDTFALKEGEVLIRYPANLSSKSYDEITDWLIREHQRIGCFVDKGKQNKRDVTHDD
jgi:hypothetical protein